MSTPACYSTTRLRDHEQSDNFAGLQPLLPMYAGTACPHGGEESGAPTNLPSAPRDDWKASRSVIDKDRGNRTVIYQLTPIHTAHGQQEHAVGVLGGSRNVS